MDPVEQAQWDEQMDRDAAAGRLDLVFREAEDEMAGGLVRDWPSRRTDPLSSGSAA
jgi:hypothetical protein